MSQPLTVYAPDISQLITEDDEPVDNIFSEKQQRLLTEPLYSSWSGPGKSRKFVAMANVGVFYIARNPAIIPDVLLSLDVEPDQDLHAKEHRSYFLWEFGKPPDIVIEVVSNKVGEEDSGKMQKYARMRVPYYVILDPEHHLGRELLRVYRLEGYKYRRMKTAYFPEAKLGLKIWKGEFENINTNWLRWTDDKGKLIATGREKALKEEADKKAALHRAALERTEKQAALQKADAAIKRAEKLAARLRELGQDPDEQ